MNDLTEFTGLRRYPLARRGFVMTSLISGFTLATQRAEAQAIHTDTAGIDAGETQIPVKDGNLPAYYARPATGTGFPIVLVNEEIFGVHATVPAAPAAVSILARKSSRQTSACRVLRFRQPRCSLRPDATHHGHA